MESVCATAPLREAAESFLTRLPDGVRKQGEQIVLGCLIKSLTCLEPGARYAAVIHNSIAPFDVTLVFVSATEAGQPGDWDTECDCQVIRNCRHAAAALVALIEKDFAVTAVKPKKKVANPARTAGEPTSALAKSLRVRLMEAKQRSLNDVEAAYVRRIEEVFKECRGRKAFMAWNAHDLGFRPPNASWDRLELWPVFPATAYELWLHVAYAACHIWGGSIPDFMKPITDFSTIDESVRAWRRAQAAKRWSALLETEEEEPASAPGEIELRLRLTAEHAVIESREAHQDAFKELKRNGCRQLLNRSYGGELAFSAQSALLWNILQPRLNQDARGDLSLAEPRVQALLGRILQAEALRDRIVTEDGEPYEFEPAPLKWNLHEDVGAGEEYGLSLTQADGTAVPEVLVTLAGRRLICVTFGRVFFGPPCPSFLLLDGEMVRIPIEAIETPAGLEFLRRLGVEPPARMQERMHVVPVNVRIRCELEPIYPGSATEQAQFSLLAQAADGSVNEYWNGTNWQAASSSSNTRVVKGAFKPSEKSPLPGEKIVVLDRSALAGAPHLLSSLAPKWEAWSGHGYVRVTKQFPELFAAWRRTVPPEVEVELVGDLQSLAEDVVSGAVKLDVAEAGIDWFDLKVILNVSDTDLSEDEVRLLLNARGGYVRLKGKGWRRLRFDLSDEEDDKLARLGLNPRDLTSEPQRLHVLQLADPAARKFLPEEQFERVQRRANELQARVTPPVPEGIAAELRPYQIEGFHFLCYLSANRFGGILADDMGLGKTLQTLTWLKWLRAQAGPGQAGLGAKRGKKAAATPATLVVCPKSVMDNWRNEANRFTPELRLRVWSSGDLDRFHDEVSSADLHVINYSQLRVVGEKLANIQWLAAILDEGQYIKNPDSQTAQVARALRADHRLILSGTPIENRLMDLWSLLTFAMPGVLGSRALFNRQFASKEDPLARRRLAARVRPFLLRRTKSQVARDLPDKIEEDLYCEMEGEQRTLYRAELKRAQQILLKVQTSKQFAEERFNFLTSLLRLRQICCDPRLVKADSRGESAKLEALVEQLEPLMEEGQKVLVFSQFVTMLDLIQETLKERNWPTFYLAGDTENRGALVDRFQNATGPAVFLISLKAGGFGLNLTSAGYVVLFDPWWNPAVENQAIDRTHRIGQTQKVIAYRLLMKDSIEEKIRLLQKEKRHLADDVLGEEKFAQSLSLDELRFLLAD